MIKLREYILIILTATIFSLISLSKSFAQENIFIIDDVKIKGVINLNFSRDGYINKAFLDSFEILMSRILLSKDLNKLSKIKLNTIKSLVNNFQILEETYRKDEYRATFKIFYNDNKVKKLLAEKNISFSQPKNISAVFFPVLFINNELQSFDENYFYNHWTDIELKNNPINFLLPVEDLDDISRIKKMENIIEELAVDELVNKYNIKNYAFALLDHNNKELNIHIKTYFDNNTMNKNISYKLDDINDEIRLKFILKDLKIQITDIWKELNIVNLLMPLSIKVKFQYANLLDLDKLRNTFYKISIIDNYVLEEFNISHTFFKINYFGNPKRLQTELSKFGYQLKNDLGYWELYIDD